MISSGADFIEVPLSRGYVAIVDREDEWALRYRWFALVLPDGRVYARRDIWIPETKRSQSILMHRDITKAPPGLEVDHLDGNGLNNRRGNMRQCGRATNARNVAGPRADNTSGYLGVSWDKSRGLWSSKIQVDGRTMNLGRYPSALEANEARLAAERRLGLIAPRRAALHAATATA